jgi:hypothetical protein
MKREPSCADYPVLFNRTLPWNQKAALVRAPKDKGGEGEGETPDNPKKKRKGTK